MKLVQKLKQWYRGERIPYTLQEMMDLQRDKFGEPPTKDLTSRFRRPSVVRGISFLYRFWLRRWTVLLPIIVGAVVALFIHFNSNPKSKIEQDYDRIPGAKNGAPIRQ